MSIATTERRAGERAPFRRRRRTSERVRLLGAPMDLMRSEEVLFLVEQKIAAGEKTLIANHNLNSLALMRKAPALADFYKRADLIEVDSRPLLYWARLTGEPGRTFHRCTYLDWRDHFWSLAQRLGWRVFYLGGAPGVADKAQDALLKTWPDLKLACRDGYFDATPGSTDNQAVVNEITAFAPQVLLVGMGMPRQELWIEANFDALPDCAILPVGAAYDYEAGVQRAAPRWAGRLGVEWLFRLAYDPGRLARRYLIEPWALIDLFAADLWRVARRRLA
jgi:N-acetylglucosaminyldiphosphoundecaprenol N-acetyl-beta-D-mannosaminyltransferase